jgi:hypothetical protein
MTEMVERVARAICKSRTCEGVACCAWPSNGGRVDCPVKRGAYNEAAHDAIAVMRDPTKTMLDAGYETRNANNWPDVERRTYQAMIDAALR